MLILGIDDAGRGPVIGSMFLAGVLVEKSVEKELKAEGVADSKTLSHINRTRLAGIIKDSSKNFKIVEATPEQIDHAVNSGLNLNTLEAIKTAEIINFLLTGIKEPVKVIVDCPSVNTNAWKATLLGYLKEKDIELHCEHKADANHISVSAASILAKCAREESLLDLKKQFGDFGSGYPSDPYTKEFLRKSGKKNKDTGIFRKSWATWKALYPEENQGTLEEL
ncbi:MAG: ribonuclease HII [Nanoarchaeota archaeon]|nr:ribonuclease HII [Nanoarchaeota archaeon]